MSSDPRLEVGFHTVAFNSAYYSFPRAVEWVRAHGVKGIEREYVDGVTLSQIDAAFPISGLTGPRVGVPYVLNTIRWAALAGCPMVDTTDGLHQPEGLSDPQAMDLMKRSYTEIVETAERYGVIVTIETHGYFTSNIERMGAMLKFVDSPSLQMTFDTGNVFISGEDPVEFLKTHIDRVGHVHIKDVAPQLAEASRGKQTGIGMSHVAIGEGANADNIRACVRFLKEHGFSGAVSLECEARGGPVLERSVSWFKSLLDDLGYNHDLSGYVAGGGA